MAFYTKALDINRYNLAEELEQQAQLFMDWALKAARAEIETKEAENDYDLIRGRAEKKIRQDPEKYGLEKVTEPAIKAEALHQKRVQKFFRKYLEALSNEKILKRAEKSFAQRKGMLESLSTLNVQLHFAEPKVPIDQETKIARDRLGRQEILNQMKRRKKIRRRR